MLRLDSRADDFRTGFARLLAAKREAAQEVEEVVRNIIADVRARGDDALIELSRRFDGVDLDSSTLRLPDSEIDSAWAAVDRETLAALELACSRIRSHHQRQIPADDRYRDDLGIELGVRHTPLAAVGLYVPGGRASYPSSVLMNAIPAVAAGVNRIVMAVPAPRGEINPLVLAAARIAGVHEIYRIGGAQAVAALALGTASIAPVDKIVGPGNAYVATAKRQLFGEVGIDTIAGPSEIVVVADADNDPDWVAADLLAQAEHDESAQAILITDNPALAEAVSGAVERQLGSLPRAEIAGASWHSHGAVILVEDLGEAAPLVDALAPEHLAIATADPEAFLAMIRNAGAVFLGRHTPEAIGDYVGGCNHVLPTGRSARFSSGLSVLDFVKRTSILRLDAGHLPQIGPAAMRLAQAEGLEGHSRSIAIRLGESDAPAR